jgi:hypothetical protein
MRKLSMTAEKKQQNDSYIGYSDAIEVLQKDEAKLIDNVVASMARMNRIVFDKHRHASRDAHAKSHGVLVGTLTVYDGLAPHLRQGLFRQPGSYPIVVRFSSAPGDINSDKIPSPKGMAIKVIGVEGRKVLAGHEDEATQDFLLVNHPVIPFGHITSYWKMLQLLEKHADDSEAAQRAVAALAKGLASVLDLAGVETPTLDALATPNHHILGETFHSMAAVRFGDYVAKISAAPLSPSVRDCTGKTYDPSHTPSIVRDQVVEFFHEQDAEFELRAQLCNDLDSMPVEDASIIWPEDRSPHQPIAKITLARQDAYSPARRVYADDVLSFNPWHCIPEHRPLGSIMRVRIKAYEASASYRHAMNVQPRTEPRDINEIPA